MVLLNDKFVTNNIYLINFLRVENIRGWRLCLTHQTPRSRDGKVAEALTFFWPLSSYLSKLSETIQLIGSSSFSSFWPLYSESFEGTLLVSFQVFFVPRLLI